MKENKTLVLLILALMVGFSDGISVFVFNFPSDSVWTIGISTAVVFFACAFVLQNIQQFYHSQDFFNITNIATNIVFLSLGLFIQFILLFWLFNLDLKSFYLDLLSFYLEFLWLRFLIGFFFLTLVQLMIWLSQMKLRQMKLQKSLIQKEREALQIELGSLQQKFKPHFLFNSLNSINALCSINPSEAQRMIQLLSDYMRTAVGQKPQELISLDKELSHLEKYVEIEKIRFGDRLTINIQRETSSSLKLPSLILQPIIENAIKYGLYESLEAVKIEINITEEDKNLVISIHNPFNSEGQKSAKGTGFGLKSIEKQLLLFYGQGNLLSTKAENDTFTTTLNIPQL